MEVEAATTAAIAALARLEGVRRLFSIAASGNAVLDDDARRNGRERQQRSDQAKADPRNWQVAIEKRPEIVEENDEAAESASDRAIDAVGAHFTMQEWFYAIVVIVAIVGILWAIMA
jgi:hypothetical protein